MAGKKGINNVPGMRQRAKDKRGGNKSKALSEHASELARLAESYLLDLAVKNYSESTIEGRRDSIKTFLTWAGERDLQTPHQITKPILESYQRHLWRYRKKNGKPLGISTQRQRLGTLKDWFAKLTRSNHLPANPASEIELPRQEKRLPEQAPTTSQIERILEAPDLLDPLGIRDRSILETFYSTGIRRSELANLKIHDLNRERGVLQIHLGKGKKDRVVPIGERALDWLGRYLEEVRPKLLLDPQEKALYITGYGEAFHPDVLSRLATKYIQQADIGRGGSCHLIRHACATHMLEGGADIRFIQQLLGHEKLETTAIYTRVSIDQLKAIHSQTHPAEAAKKEKNDP